MPWWERLLLVWRRLFITASVQGGLWGDPLRNAYPQPQLPTVVPQECEPLSHTLPYSPVITSAHFDALCRKARVQRPSTNDLPQRPKSGFGTVRNDITLILEKRGCALLWRAYSVASVRTCASQMSVVVGGLLVRAFSGTFFGRPRFCFF